MKLTQHLLRLVTGRDSQMESVDLAQPRDVQWGTPIFKAPALPTPHQLSRELPFTENLRPRFRPSR